MVPFLLQKLLIDKLTLVIRSQTVFSPNVLFFHNLSVVYSVVLQSLVNLVLTVGLTA